MAGPIGVGSMSVISGLLTTTGVGAWEAVSWEPSKAGSRSGVWGGLA